MPYDKVHDASAIIVTFSYYHYFYALGNVIIVILSDKMLMAYWQLVLFPAASSCTFCLRPLNIIVGGR